VSLDVFYAERHTVGSHFRIETTIRLDQAVNEDWWLTIAKWPVWLLLLLVLLLPLLFVLPLCVVCFCCATNNDQDGELSPEQDPVLATDGAPNAIENIAAPQRLAVSILQAHGLKHMNNFTGDNPYVTCEVKHLDAAAETTRVETNQVSEGDTLNPFWGETHNVEPWCEGESLEFTVYDKGLVASKTEGKAVLPPDLFFPQGFSGMIAISGLPHALLHVIVRPLGPSGETAVDPDASSKKKKKKKLKVGKKSKGCC